MAHRRRGAVVLLATALVVSPTGCAGDGSGEDPSGSAPVATEETDPGQTEQPGESDTVDPSVAIAEGAGCEPGPGDLSDGQWYGTVEDLTSDELGLDLACWFIGEDAVMAAEEDGEESPPPNDYYVRDESADVRTVPIDPAATVVMYPTGSPESQEGTVPDLIDAAETRGGFPYGVWIEVVAGSIVSLQEQWVP